MGAATDGFGLFCGALDCPEDAGDVIDHPDHGPRAVCDGHADGYEVDRDI